MKKMMTRLDRRSYSAGRFLLAMDGYRPAWIRSVSGGATRADVTETAVGGENCPTKQLGPLDVEPITIELGMNAEPEVFQWITDSWRRKPSHRSGSILYCDDYYRGVVRQSFTDALLVETTFPTLDGSSKEPAYLTLKLQPEEIAIEKETSGARIKGEFANNQQKEWHSSNFAFRLYENIHGCKGPEMDCRYVNRIESFTVSQRIRKLHTGHARFPTIEPIDVSVPNITITMALAHADAFIDWHKNFVLRGGAGHAKEMLGEIILLDPSCGRELLTVDLVNVGICSLAIEKSDASQPGIQRCRVELYVEEMKISDVERFDR